MPSAVPDPADVADRPGAADPAAPRPFAPTFFHGTKAALAPGDHVAPGTRPTSARARTRPAGSTAARPWTPRCGGPSSPGATRRARSTSSSRPAPSRTTRADRPQVPGQPDAVVPLARGLRVVGEVTGWRGHAPAALRAMREMVARQTREEDQPPPAGAPAARRAPADRRRPRPHPRGDDGPARRPGRAGPGPLRRRGTRGPGTRRGGSRAHDATRSAERYVASRLSRRNAPCGASRPST
jgi:rifampin ADP-ribosylating transferase